jgi:uncharacterized peroxidase-related enzyme
VAHHAEGLRRAGKEAAFVAAVVEDYRTAPIPAVERAMLDFAARLTRSPWEAAEADVLGLRRMGLSDRAILDLVLVISYFAFVNRVADGLGVELEAGLPETAG